MRRNVARWAAGTISPQAYVVDDTGFAKDGTASPCVSRQYSGTLGKIGNCKVAVSVHLVTDHASPAANWRLFCPAGWDDTLAKDPGAAEEIGTGRDPGRGAAPGEVAAGTGHARRDDRRAHRSRRW